MIEPASAGNSNTVAPPPASRRTPDKRGGRARARRGPIATSASPRRHGRRPRRRRRRARLRASASASSAEPVSVVIEDTAPSRHGSARGIRGAHGGDRLVRLRHVHDALRQHEARAECLARPGQHRVPMLRVPLRPGRPAPRRDSTPNRSRDIARSRRRPLRGVAPPRRSPHWRAGSAACAPGRSRLLARSIPRRSPPPARAVGAASGGAPASSPACRRAAAATAPRPRRHARCVEALAQTWAQRRGAPPRVGSSGWFSKISVKMSRIRTRVIVRRNRARELASATPVMATKSARSRAMQNSTSKIRVSPPCCRPFQGAKRQAKTCS